MRRSVSRKHEQSAQMYEALANSEVELEGEISHGRAKELAAWMILLVKSVCLQLISSAASKFCRRAFVPTMGTVKLHRGECLLGVPVSRGLGPCPWKSSSHILSFQSINPGVSCNSVTPGMQPPRVPPKRKVSLRQEGNPQESHRKIIPGEPIEKCPSNFQDCLAFAYLARMYLSTLLVSLQPRHRGVNPQASRMHPDRECDSKSVEEPETCF